MVEVAAVALLLGVDPVEYASRGRVERAWTDVVVRRAWELRVAEVASRG